MKKIAFVLLVCISMIACKDDGVKPGADGNYLKDAVGKADGGKFVVTNANAIKEGWKSAPLIDSTSIDIEGFEILHGLTEGDAQEEYYLLIAKNKEGDVKTAAPLVLKGNEFYFDEPGQTSTYLKITCKSACTDGCNPVIKIAEGSRYLICSYCADCRKVESEMR